MEDELNAELRISADDPLGELVSLTGWLKKRNALADKVRPVYHEPGRDEPSGAVRALAVTLDPAGTGLALAEELTAWLAERGPDVTVTVTAPAGTATVAAGPVPEIPDALRKILA